MALDKERLQKKYVKAEAALESLKEAISDIGNVEQLAKCANTSPKKLYKTFQDSIIQRFEYTFDLTWKYLSEYLQFQGRMLEIKTPKSVFRESLKAKILSEPEVRLALNMVDHRNLTTHGYDEILVNEISKSIPDYSKLLEQVLKATRPNF